MRTVTKRVRWMLGGAVIGWFFDPAHGGRRRATAASTAGRWSGTVRQVTEGLVGWLPPRSRQRATRLLDRLPGPGDEALRRRIERDVLRPAGVTGVLIDVQDGHVVVERVTTNIDSVALLAERIERFPQVLSVEVRLPRLADGGAAA